MNSQDKQGLVKALEDGIAALRCVRAIVEATDYQEYVDASDVYHLLHVALRQEEIATRRAKKALTLLPSARETIPGLCDAAVDASEVMAQLLDYASHEEHLIEGEWQDDLSGAEVLAGKALTRLREAVKLAYEVYSIPF